MRPDTSACAARLDLVCLNAAFHALCRLEGIIPALESSHALAYAAKLAPTLSSDAILLVNLSGRGDKDMHTVAEHSGIRF